MKLLDTGLVWHGRAEQLAAVGSPTAPYFHEGCGWSHVIVRQEQYRPGPSAVCQMTLDDTVRTICCCDPSSSWLAPLRPPLEFSLSSSAPFHWRVGQLVADQFVLSGLDPFLCNPRFLRWDRSELPSCSACLTFTVADDFHEDGHLNR